MCNSWVFRVLLKRLGQKWTSRCVHREVKQHRSDNNCTWKERAKRMLHKGTGRWTNTRANVCLSRSLSSVNVWKMWRYILLRINKRVKGSELIQGRTPTFPEWQSFLVCLCYERWKTGTEANCDIIGLSWRWKIVTNICEHFMTDI